MSTRVTRSRSARKSPLNSAQRQVLENIGKNRRASSKSNPRKTKSQSSRLNVAGRDKNLTPAQKKVIDNMNRRNKLNSAQREVLEKIEKNRRASSKSSPRKTKSQSSGTDKHLTPAQKKVIENMNKRNQQNKNLRAIQRELDETTGRKKQINTPLKRKISPSISSENSISDEEITPKMAIKRRPVITKSTQTNIPTDRKISPSVLRAHMISNAENTPKMTIKRTPAISKSTQTNIATDRKIRPSVLRAHLIADAENTPKMTIKKKPIVSKSTQTQTPKQTSILEDSPIPIKRVKSVKSVQFEVQDETEKPKRKSSATSTHGDMSNNAKNEKTPILLQTHSIKKLPNKNNESDESDESDALFTTFYNRQTTGKQNKSATSSKDKTLKAQSANKVKTLTSNAIARLLNQNMSLTDEVIDVYSAALKNVSRAFDGFISLKNISLNGDNHGLMDTVNPFIQIIDISDGHWITITNLDCEDPTQVRIFDSCFNFDSYRNNIFWGRLKKLLFMDNANRAIEVLFEPVQQQKGENSSGLFALAFAHDLCISEKDPTKQNYDEDVMRVHLHMCFINENLLEFPKHQIRNCRRNSLFQLKTML